MKKLLLLAVIAISFASCATGAYSYTKYHGQKNVKCRGMQETSQQQELYFKVMELSTRK